MHVDVQDTSTLVARGWRRTATEEELLLVWDPQCEAVSWTRDWHTFLLGSGPSSGQDWCLHNPEAALLICQGGSWGRSGGIRFVPQGKRSDRCRSPGLCRLLGTMIHPEGEGRHFLSLKGEWWLKLRALPWRVAWSARHATAAVEGKPVVGIIVSRLQCVCAQKALRWAWITPS